MKNDKYARARSFALTLNRLGKHNARPRRGEKKSHFEKDSAIAKSVFRDSNVLGFGVGPKITNRERATTEICLVFFVRKKLPRSRLRNNLQVPKHFSLNILGSRIGTDVQEWGGPPVAHGSVNPGVSIGDVSGNSGTATLVVQDRFTGAQLLLGCSHVLAACGRGKVGDEVDSPTDPGGALGPNVVGHLLRFTTIDASSLTNAVDAAVATVSDGVQLSNSIPGIGTPVNIRDLTLEGDAVIDQLAVNRVGAVTGVQSGTIRNLHVSTRITYHQISGDPSVYFMDLVQYDAISEEGDSGGVVIDTADAPSVVGMHIASLEDGSGSLFTHVRYVFDTMQVDLWTPPS
jgi:hypothetical protein